MVHLKSSCATTTFFFSVSRYRKLTQNWHSSGIRDCVCSLKTGLFLSFERKMAGIGIGGYSVLRLTCGTDLVDLIADLVPYLCY